RGGVADDEVRCQRGDALDAGLAAQADVGRIAGELDAGVPAAESLHVSDADRLHAQRHHVLDAGPLQGDDLRCWTGQGDLLAAAVGDRDRLATTATTTT